MAADASAIHAEIVAIGAELLTPFKQDTNSLFLTEELNLLGVKVAFKDVVGDDRTHLTNVARVAVERSGIIIFMGGLGPTEDDLTRECVADALGIEVHPDPEIITELYKRFASRRIVMPENNARQAHVLDGAKVLANSRGTAPGQWLDTRFNGEPRYIMLLPGPPHELKPMFMEQCVPRLREALPEAHFARRVLKLAMLGESYVDSIAAPIYNKRTEVQTTILASAAEVQLHLTSSAASRQEAQCRVDSLADELDAAFGPSIFSTEGEPLEEIVGLYLGMRGMTVSVAESCTGGMIGERLTAVPGSSRWFMGGAIVYSNQMKVTLAGVSAKLIEQFGAVSDSVARALAEGIRARCGTHIGIGVTGIAGPAGGSAEKPVGLVYVAVADERGTEVMERQFLGDRQRVRLGASQQALDMVRRRLLA
ncbi:MAG: competence/damage-inducible protein A [Acidobacteriaceae bacterium]